MDDLVRWVENDRASAAEGDRTGQEQKLLEQRLCRFSIGDRRKYSIRIRCSHPPDSWDSRQKSGSSSMTGSCFLPDTITGRKKWFAAQSSIQSCRLLNASSSCLVLNLDLAFTEDPTEPLAKVAARPHLLDEEERFQLCLDLLEDFSCQTCEFWQDLAEGSFPLGTQPTLW